MTTTEKIILLKYIKDNYSQVRYFWTSEAVEEFEKQINKEVMDIRKKMFPNLWP